MNNLESQILCKSLEPCKTAPIIIIKLQIKCCEWIVKKCPKLLYCRTTTGETAVEIGRREGNFNKREIHDLEIMMEKNCKFTDDLPKSDESEEDSAIMKIITKVERNAAQIKYLKTVVSQHSKIIKQLEKYKN